MDDFTFEEKVCKYTVNLSQLCKEVLVSFNIDQCPSRKGEKISVSLFYNEKLVIENKKALDQFANVIDKVGNYFAKLYQMD